MATGEVHVSVVDVGQGQSTFVEIYNTGGKLVQTLLFDCGSDKQSTETQTNLQYIADKVSSMDTPTFDCVFFSHSDKDHVYLMYDLLDKFDDKPKVELVWYAGNRTQYTKYGNNILDDLESDYNTTIKKTYADNTGYDTVQGKYVKFLWRSPDKEVVVRAIVSNVLTGNITLTSNRVVEKGKTAEVKNRVSMVCGLYYANSSYVICGDATYKTMAAINTLFFPATTVFDNNLMLTLPHHGSRATGFAVKSGGPASVIAIGVVDTFSGIMKANSISVSAYQKHHHPSLELMNHFIPTQAAPILRDPRLGETNSHLVTAYLDIDLIQPVGWSLVKGASYDFVTRTNTFTTKYYGGFLTYFTYNLGDANAKKAKPRKSGSGAINEFASWKYETQTDGTFLLGGYANLSAALFTRPTVSTSSSKEVITIHGSAQEDILKKVTSPKINTVQTRRKNKKTYQPILLKSRITNKIRSVA